MCSGTQRQDFDHEGNAFRSPVCFGCLPEHRAECPRGQLVGRFAYVHGGVLPELPCTCAQRRLALELASAWQEVVADPDREKEQEIERALVEGIATAESWEGSGVYALTITPALWPLEFNWYFLLQENQRRHEAHGSHVATCRKSVCGDIAHIRPDCPPGHSWLEDWPSFTDEVITSIACHPSLSWAWEELACWRADVQYWIERLPPWAYELFRLRIKSKSERDIVLITGWTRYTVRKRLKWLSWFLRHAADSKWRQAESDRWLERGEPTNEAVTQAGPAASGVSYALGSTERETYASNRATTESDTEAVAGGSQA